RRRRKGRRVLQRQEPAHPRAPSRSDGKPTGWSRREPQEAGLRPDGPKGLGVEAQKGEVTCPRKQCMKPRSKSAAWDLLLVLENARSSNAG
ncbi:unnamed protein product, partial [Gulo gulo]